MQVRCSAEAYGCGRAADEGAKDVRVNFRTVRPADYSTPYETLLKNQVHFAAVDKGNNRLLNVMVRRPHGPHPKPGSRVSKEPQKVAQRASKSSLLVYLEMQPQLRGNHMPPPGSCCGWYMCACLNLFFNVISCVRFAAPENLRGAA